MAAGLGFKTFVTGEVLTAADTNGYLMQGVNVFADAAARTAAITSPQEGQMSYLKDTNSVESYSGSAWVAVGGSSGFPASTTYTPTVTATSGTATSVTATGNYSQSGKYVVLNVNINITTKGTATGAVIFTLPIAAKTGSFLSAGVCQEIAASGQMGNILCVPSISTTTAQIRRYDFATFWSDGFNPCGTLIYEVA